MVSRYASDPHDRWKGAAAAIGVQAAIGFLLVSGLAARFPQAASEGLKLFRVAPIPPLPAPPPPVPPRVRTDRPEGRASPPDLRNQATQLVAPPPVIPLVVPPPVIAADKAGVGAARNTGAADIPGPGTGAGGVGDGTGSGGAGDGDGGGGGSPPEWRSGRIRDRDFPRGLGEAGVQGAVAVRYDVGVDGRVSNCRIDQSSGSRALDETTCRLITERFRFRPARDAGGRPVRSTIVENHEWVVESWRE